MSIINFSRNNKDFYEKKRNNMREKKKHYGLKLLLILLLAFCGWVYFWQEPAPQGPFEIQLNNDVLQN